MTGRAQESSSGPMMKPLEDAESSRNEVTNAFLLNVCAELDGDSSGMTIEKLIEGFETNEQLRSFLRRLGIFRDDLQSIFAILDDGSGVLSHNTFAEQLVRMQRTSNDSLLMFIRLHAAKAQQKFEEQLIWFEHRREAADAAKADIPQRIKSAPVFETDLSTVKRPVKRQLTPVGTPFATMSDCHSSGSLFHTASKDLYTSLNLGDVGSKLRDFQIVQAPEAKLQSEVAVAARGLSRDVALRVSSRGAAGFAMACELDLLRSQIDLHFEALAYELARDGIDELAQVRGALPCSPNAVAMRRAANDRVGPPLAMPAPDIGITPPPPDSGETGRRWRKGSPGAARRVSKIGAPPREEEPKSESPFGSLRAGLQLATGISCCGTEQAKRSNFVIVDTVE